MKLAYTSMIRWTVLFRTMRVSSLSMAHILGMDGLIVRRMPTASFYEWSNKLSSRCHAMVYPIRLPPQASPDIVIETRHWLVQFHGWDSGQTCDVTTITSSSLDCMSVFYMILLWFYIHLGKRVKMVMERMVRGYPICPGHNCQSTQYISRMGLYL